MIILNVPNLRFPEFHGEWEETSLSSLGDFIGGGTPSSAIINLGEGNIPWISSSDLSESNINRINVTRYITEEAIDNSATKICQAPTILIVSRVGVGKVAYSKENICTSQDFTNIVNFKSDGLFLTYLLSKIMRQKARETQGTSIKGITSGEIKSIKINIPPNNEQEKIATFLSLIDERIETQNKIIEKLKSLIKGLDNLLFCDRKSKPALRFPEYLESWRKSTLKEFASRVTRKNKDNETQRALTIAAQYGLVDQMSFFNKQVASNDMSNYYLLYNSEFAYNKSYSKDYPWGAVKRLDLYEKGALSTLYICFKPVSNINSDYLVHYFESNKWHQAISEIAGEGARNHGLLNIPIDSYFNTMHYLPSSEEQKKIASFLTKIDHKIQTEKAILEQLERQKKYLLEQMFV